MVQDLTDVLEFKRQNWQVLTDVLEFKNKTDKGLIGYTDGLWM